MSGEELVIERCVVRSRVRANTGSVKSVVLRSGGGLLRQENSVGYMVVSKVSSAA